MHQRIMAFILILLASINHPSIASNLINKNFKKSKYEYIKLDSITENKDVFKKYEKAKSRKIIYVCDYGNGRYSVRAQWDLKIKDRDEAETIALEDCNEALAQALLLGYKTRKEFRF